MSNALDGRPYIFVKIDRLVRAFLSRTDSDSELSRVPFERINRPAEVAAVIAVATIS